MVDMNGSFFIQVANFIILIFILNIVLYRPIRKILSERKAKFDNLEQGIEMFNKDALEKEDAFARGIKEARANGVKEKEALIAEATEEEKQIINEINEKAQADLAGVREKISADTDSVRTALQAQIDDFANAIGEKILGRAV
jgi:F-type H+-transporting ATPase subunit b